MAVFVLVNPLAGKGDFSPIVRAASERGIDVHVLERGDDPAALARAADATVLDVAGGDGSLAAVAGVAVERDLPFLAVPAGTRNHFARDAGLRHDDPVAALDALDGGAERRIDLAWANDRPFLNNVSLGVYAHLVQRRETHRQRREAFARLRALGLVARDRRPVALTLDGAPVEARVVLVANNAYRLDVLSLGERERLDEGRLHVYLAAGLLRTSWQERAAERLVIDSGRERVEAAVDGDPHAFDAPVEFRIEPRALRLLVPRSPD